MFEDLIQLASEEFLKAEEEDKILEEKLSKSKSKRQKKAMEITEEQEHEAID